MRALAPRICRRLAVSAITLAVAALLGSREARAAELVYWDNALGNTIGVVNVDGTGAGLVNASGAGLDAPEGMSFDPVTNRLYVASEGLSVDGHIAYVNLDGSGGGNLPLPPGTPVKDPRGVAADPIGRIVYWLNDTNIGPETIYWARLDGSEAGEFSLAGQALSAAVRLVADPGSGRLYWGNIDGSFHFAPLIGRTGAGGTLEAKGRSPGATPFGLSIDPLSNRFFWVEESTDAVLQADLDGSFVNEIVGGGSPIDRPQGLAFDPVLNRIYWANSGNETNPNAALGFANLGGLSGGITPGVAVSNPQDPVVIKSPTGTEAPQLTLANGRLQCSQGSWGPDYVASFVYQSPRSFAYGWTRNGSPIPGASDAGYTPTESGSYACVVTASNQAGSASQTSAASKMTVTRPIAVTTNPVASKAPKPKRTTANLVLAGGKDRHLRAKPGKLLVLRVRAVNRGTAASKPVPVCLKLARSAKRALRPGKCRQLAAVPAGASATVMLRLRVRGSAKPGRYRLRIVLAGDRTEVTVRVLG